MRYVFWQNMLSIHQASFLRALSQTEEVCLVVEQPIEEERLKTGWNIPDFGKVKVVISPNSDQVPVLLKDDAIHVFSGVNLDSFPMMKQAFSIAMRLKLKVGIISEPFNSAGLKGKIRSFKYKYLRMMYDKSLSFILVTGEEGRHCYQKTGFSKEKIFDWGYFTESINVQSNDNILSSEPDKISLIFVGSIDQRKNILALTDVFGCVPTNLAELKIIGKGELEGELKNKIEDKPNIKYLGSVNNSTVSAYISSSDLLILPSLFDGWGAVVNEALMCGTPVIASNYCGASVLLDGEERGEVFCIEENNLEKILTKWIEKGKVSEEQRNQIKQWAENNISGTTAARYFLDIMASVFATGKRPVAPWLKRTNTDKR